MKKVFFAFVAATVVALSACNSKAPESTETPVDSTATAPVEEVAAEVAPADTAAATADTTAAPAN